MDNKLTDTVEHTESDEEDYEIYFLQPASSPYNIKEKLDAANKALSEDNPDLDSRPLKVKFREEVDYEPDLTDDDVQSIESFNEVDFSIMDVAMDVAPSHPPTKLEVNIFTPTLATTEEEYDGHNDGEEEDDEGEENSDEIIEEEEFTEEVKLINHYNKLQFVQIMDDDDDGQLSNEESLSSDVSINEDISYREIEEPADSCRNLSRNSTPTISSRSTTRTSTSSHKLKKIDIDCKTHCIEKIETELNLTISKLQIAEKPMCPTLKLIQRKCCEKNHTKHEQRLPCYTGMRSEYGLSKAQLERRQKRKENSKMREEKRKKLVQEYKERKNQQNEEIFCQWLKTVEKRKQEQAKLRENSKYCPKIVNFPRNPSTMIPQIRPKTAPKPRIPNTIKKLKRPSTSPACVFIQVSPNMLKEGFRVGDLFFKESKGRKAANELNIVALS